MVPFFNCPKCGGNVQKKNTCEDCGFVATAQAIYETGLSAIVNSCDQCCNFDGQPACTSCHSTKLELDKLFKNSVLIYEECCQTCMLKLECIEGRLPKSAPKQKKRQKNLVRFFARNTQIKLNYCATFSAPTCGN